MQIVPGTQPDTQWGVIIDENTSEQDGSRLWVTSTTLEANYFDGSGLVVGPYGDYVEGVPLICRYSCLQWSAFVLQCNIFNAAH